MFYGENTWWLKNEFKKALLSILLIFTDKLNFL